MTHLNVHSTSGAHPEFDRELAADRKLLQASCLSSNKVESNSNTFFP